MYILILVKDYIYDSRLVTSHTILEVILYIMWYIKNYLKTIGINNKNDCDDDDNHKYYCTFVYDRNALL